MGTGCLGPRDSTHTTHLLPVASGSPTSCPIHGLFLESATKCGPHRATLCWAQSSSAPSQQRFTAPCLQAAQLHPLTPLGTPQDSPPVPAVQYTDLNHVPPKFLSRASERHLIWKWGLYTTLWRKTAAERAVRRLPAPEREARQPPPEAGREQDCPLEPLEGARPCCHLRSDFWPPAL